MNLIKKIFMKYKKPVFLITAFFSLILAFDFMFVLPSQSKSVANPTIETVSNNVTTVVFTDRKKSTKDMFEDIDTYLELKGVISDDIISYEVSNTYGETQIIIVYKNTPIG